MEGKRYSEEELIDPALFEINKHENGLTTGQLIKVLTELLEPSGEDLEILFGRKDTRFSQKVRNLISHKSLYPKYVDYNPESSLLKINSEGRKRLLSSSFYQEIIEKNCDNELEFDGSEDLTYTEDLNNYFYENNKKLINCEPLNYSVFDLKRRFNKSKSNTGSLILDDTFQRNNVWSRKQQSQLIESLLLGIPIPYLYLYEDKNMNLIVIDGRQRLSAIFDYLEDKFKLTNMEFLTKLEGKKASDLKDTLIDKFEKFKAKIEDAHLHVIKVSYDTPEIFKLKIFERVNQNGTKLNNQELRHALHQGPITSLLKKVSDNLDILSSKSAKSRMKDRYLILRYMAMRLYVLNELKFYKENNSDKHVDYTEINTFLADSMDAINTFSVKQLNEMEIDFLECYTKALKLLGSSAFRLDENAPINMILFETTLLIISLSKNLNLTDTDLTTAIANFRKFNENNVDEDGNTPFFQNIKYHRDSKENYKERILWINTILDEYKGK